MKVGSPPKVLGTFELECPEFMFVQYMPIYLPNGGFALPRNMEWCRPLINEAWMDSDMYGDGDYKALYMYLTAKHMHVESGTYPNRPGWHIDGFGTDDVNYIWYDKDPTLFALGDFDVREGHEESLEDMQKHACDASSKWETYPVNSLLRLDNKCVHEVQMSFESGVRTFVKISVSKHKYNLKGNAHNYLLDYNWDMFDREQTRNHPIKET